ncbi:hypothetical protein B0H13DRAFT_1868178 [Mycena leptocephala]|nr:hypothetical protein B0H13DRAFT_1868178 [Mycena leptocephala]
MAEGSKKAKAKSPEKSKGKVKAPETAEQIATKEMRKSSRETKKLEAETKKAAALSATIPEALAMVSKEFFLGFGVSSVVTDRLDRDGPTVVTGPLQRARQKEAMLKLETIAGENSEGLLRLDSMHALTFGVNPVFLDLNTLSKDSNGSFVSVGWKEGACDAKITMYAGYHRIQFLREATLQETYNEFCRVDKLVKKNPSNEKHRDHREKLIDKLHKDGTWLIAFYDALTPLKEKFLKDVKKAQTVLMQLSTNNVLSSHPDPPLHHFNNLARTLTACKAPEDRNQLLAYVKSAMPGDVSTLLFKHKDVVELMACIHNIPAFAAVGLKPSQLLEAKKTFWGLLEPFIRGGYYQLVYISSLLDDVLGDGDKAIYSQRVADHFTKNADGTPKPGDITAQSIDGLAKAEILNKLVEIFDSAFETNLEPKMEYFGLRGSEVWSTAMGHYEKDVKEKVAQFVEEEEDEDEKWGKDAIAILKSVQNKVEHVLERQLMTCYPFLPAVPGKVPLFSPPSYKQMAGLFVPGLSDFKSQRAGSRAKSTGDVATPSETCLILHHLSYFQYRGNIDKDWVALALPKPGMAGNRLPLVRFMILQHRTRVLRKHCNKIERVIGLPKPKYTQDYDTIIMTAIKSWFELALEAERKRTSSVKMADIRLRHLQKCPKKVYSKDDNHPFQKHSNFRRGLEWSIMNFLGGASNNHVPVRRRYSEAVWGEYKVLKASVYPMLKDEMEEFLSFQAGILALIVGTAGMEQWQFWYINAELEASPVTASLPAAVDADVSTLRIDLRNEAFHSTLIDGFTMFAKTLNKTVHGGLGLGLRGRRTFEGILALHPKLSTLMESLYTAAEEIHEDLAAIENEDSTHVLSAVAWTKPKNKFPKRGIPIAYGSEADIAAHYECDVRETPKLTYVSAGVNTQGGKKRQGEEVPNETPPLKKTRTDQSGGSDIAMDVDHSNGTAYLSAPPGNQLLGLQLGLH